MRVKCVFCPQMLEDSDLGGHLRDFHRIPFHVGHPERADVATQTDKRSRGKKTKRRSKRKASVEVVTSTPKKSNQELKAEAPDDPLNCTYVEEMSLKLESEAEPEEELVEVQIRSPVKLRIRSTGIEKGFKTGKNKSRYKNVSSGSSMMYSFVDSADETIIDIIPESTQTSVIQCSQIEYSSTDLDDEEPPKRVAKPKRRRREVRNLKDDLYDYFALPSRCRKRLNIRRPLPESKRLSRKTSSLLKSQNNRQQGSKLHIERVVSKFCHRQSYSSKYGIPTSSFYSKNRRNPKTPTSPRMLEGLKDQLSHLFSPSSSSRSVVVGRRNRFRISEKRKEKRKKSTGKTKARKTDFWITSLNDASSDPPNEKSTNIPVFSTNNDAEKTLEDIADISSRCRNRNLEAKTYKYSETMRRKLRRRLREEAQDGDSQASSKSLNPWYKVRFPTESPTVGGAGVRRKSASLAEGRMPKKIKDEDDPTCTPSSNQPEVLGRSGRTEKRKMSRNSNGRGLDEESGCSLEFSPPVHGFLGSWVLGERVTKKTSIRDKKAIDCDLDRAQGTPCPPQAQPLNSGEEANPTSLVDAGLDVRLQCDHCDFTALEEHMRNEHQEQGRCISRQQLRVVVERVRDPEVVKENPVVQKGMAQVFAEKETVQDIKQLVEETTIQVTECNDQEQDNSTNFIISNPRHLSFTSEIEPPDPVSNPHFCGLTSEVKLDQDMSITSDPYEAPSYFESHSETVSLRSSMASAASSRSSSRCLTPHPALSTTPLWEEGEERRRKIKTMVRGLEEEGTADFSLL